jgi:hypothetical protein
VESATPAGSDLQFHAPFVSDVIVILVPATIFAGVLDALFE